VPGPEDDLTEVCCRVTARNAAGETAAETAAVRVTYVAPVPVGELPDEIFDEDTGAQEVPTAQAFEGQNLAFTVTGAGASIDAATGVVTIDTATPGVESITVAAANSGGEARQSLLVTVEALPAIQPELSAIAADLWLFAAEAWSAERNGARVSITPAAAIKVPDGYELRGYIGSNPAGVGATGMTAALVPGTKFTTNGFFSGDLHARLFWRELANDGYGVADEGGKNLRVEATVPAAPAVPGQLPPWNEIVRNEAELKTVIAAHSNDATSWRVGLAAGDYGTLDLREIRSVRGAPIIFGSADYAGLGAKVRRLLLTNSDRLIGHFLDIDRAGQPSLGTGGPNATLVDMQGAHDCGLQWSRIRGAAWNARSRNSDPYVAHNGVAIRDTSLRRPHRNVVRHCAIGGHLMNGIFWEKGDDHELIGCVFFDMGGDNIRVSDPARFKMIDNWGARRHRIFDPGDGKHDHLDFYQSYAGMSQNTRIREHTIRGNVWMPDPVTDREGTPTQAICNHDNVVDDFIIEQNIIVTTSPWAIAFAANKSYSSPTPGQRNRVANNTVFRWVNSQNVAPHNAAIVVHGANSTPGSGNNIHLHWDSSTQPSGGGVVIVRQGENYSNARSYYGGRGDTLNYGASFYDIRPLPAMATHWGQSAAPIGAARRFREVIEEGKHPGNQPGPVAQYWRDQYDPRSQITS
jgi:hypothetical protein